MNSNLSDARAGSGGCITPNRSLTLPVRIELYLTGPIFLVVFDSGPITEFMLYRPNFCCHCGEKITRAEWTPLTSRRFCDFCAVEQKQHDLVPRAAAVVVLLVGAAGLTAYFGSGAKPSGPEASAAVREQRRISPGATGHQPSDPKMGNSAISANTGASVVSAPNSALPEKEQRTAPANSSTESVYYCGATTKKGTPCTRRVKVPGPCWQHSRDAAERGTGR